MSQKRVARHKAVYITYSILDQAGQVLEQYDIPVGYVHGGGSRLLEKLEEALDGAAVGDRVSVEVTPEEGFGPHQPELTHTEELENVPPEYRHLGAEAMFQNEQGETITMRVTHIEDGKLTLDGNHPLAGKNLTFLVRVESVRDATPQEIASGMPADGSQMLH